MKSEKELFELAKMYVMLDREFERPLPEYEVEEIKESMANIRNTLLQKGYDVNTFMHYQKLYREMSIGEYFEFIKTLQ